MRVRLAATTLATLVVCIAGSLNMAPALAAELSLPVVSEAWLSIPPTCALPVGCTPLGLPEVNVYPAGTLHVAINAGVEQARTYVKLGLESLPFGAIPAGGSLTLPLNIELTSGSRDYENADVIACLVEAPFPDGAQGSIDPGPEIDCAISSPTHLITTSDRSDLVVDLEPFVETWAAGRANNGIALVAPLSALESRGTWHVAFYGRGSGGPNSEATTNYTLPAPSDSPELPLGPPVAFAPPYIPPGTPQPLDGIPQPPRVVTPVAPIASLGFQYAGAFVLPLVGLATLLLLGYSLTREDAPAGFAEL